MAYQIEYGANGARTIYTKSRIPIRKIGITMAILVLGAIILWSSGCDWSVTAAALETMAEEVGQGSGIADAFSTFCIEILQGA